MELRAWSFLLLLVVPPFWYKGDALNMLPFFLFGAFLLPKVLNIPKGVFVIVSTLCAAIYLGAVLFCGDFWENGLAFYTNYLDIYHFKPDLLSQFLTRCVLGLCGSLALIGVLRGLLASFHSLGGLAPIGEQTMGVYFIHRYGLAIFAGCGFFTDSLTGLFASAVLVFLFCSIIVAVSKRNRICRIALWGVKIKS